MTSHLQPIGRRKALQSLAAATLAAGLARTALGQSAPAAAPTLSPQAGFYRFKVGEFDALSLHDGTFVVQPVHPVFGFEGTAAEVESLLRAEDLPTDRHALALNLLVVRTGRETVLFDTGCGHLYGPAFGQLFPHLAAAGLSPAEITAIFVSHAHGDHIGGLVDADGRPRFPNAAVYITRAEQAFWFGPEPDFRLSRYRPEAVQNSIAGARRALDGVKDRLQIVLDGDEPIPGIRVIDAAGHTPGHCNFLIESAGERLLHLADTCHSHVFNFARPQWSVQFDIQPPLAVENRLRTFVDFARRRTRLFGYHLPFPGLGRVRPEGLGYRWHPEPWSFGA